MNLDEPVTRLQIDQRVFDLYDEYCHGGMDRREFLARAALVAGGLAMAQALLPRYVAALQRAGGQALLGSNHRILQEEPRLRSDRLLPPRGVESDHHRHSRR